jgi:UDP:flavonoid glycosyltransferase YjiC (YdhE family)
MKFTILVIGSRGDVQPLIALGSGLKRAGHEVKIATHDIFKEMITSRGLEFFPIHVNPKELLVGKEGREWLDTGLNMIKFSWKLKNLIKSSALDVLDDLWSACAGTDAIIFSILSVVGPDIAEKMGIPCFATFLQPVTPTYAFPSFMAPSISSFNKFYNKLTGLIGEQLYWRIFSKSVNRWRKEFLKLHKKPFYGPFMEMRDKKLPIFYGFSPIVVPKPSDWPSWIYITGYWFLDIPPKWKAPKELIDFLESGPPPVYVGFGSMSHIDPEGITNMILDVLQMTGQRGILGTNWSGLGDNIELPDYVFKVENIPFDWLFPRMSAAVHHGGAGTTASALRAGIPSVIIPFFGDQFFWARRVYNLKVGPPPIRKSNLNKETLSRAIKKALKSEEIITGAKEIGQKIRSENGVEKAVRAIEKNCT